MVRKTRKQKGGDLEKNPNTDLRSGSIVINGEEVQIGKNANLIGKNLEGAHLEGADLRGANLEGANLERANLEGADLRGANLEGAILIVADLKQANLENANLERAKLAGTKLSGAVLGGADLRDAKLFNTHLEGADLRDANLTGAYLYHTHLEGANLQGKDLSRKVLEAAYLNEANLEQANLENANLARANLTGAHLSGAVLRDADLKRAMLTEADLKQAVLRGANLEGAYLHYTHFEGADLTDANLTDVHVLRYIYNNSTRWPANYIPQRSAPLPQQPVQETKITLTQNMINSKNSNSCNDKLYKEIMRLTPEEIKDKSFKFQGQSGIDIGGLTRIVHSLFLKSFINKFFEGDETKILKDKVNLDELNKATEILIALTEKTKRVWGHHGEETPGSINVITIRPSLFNILFAKNVEEYITANQNKTKYHKTKNYNLLEPNGRKTYVKAVKAYNSEEPVNLNSLLNGSNSIQNNAIKKYMITFLTMNGFKSYNQYVTMREWVQEYWVPNSTPDRTLFTIHLQFDFETFSKRVILIFNDGHQIKLSDFSNNNATTYSNYQLLLLFLNYLHHSDQYRKNFNMLVSGSSTYGGILRIIFEEQAKPDALYHAHTCSCEINIYNNVVSMSINDLNGTIEGEIKNIKIQD